MTPPYFFKKMAWRGGGSVSSISTDKSYSQNYFELHKRCLLIKLHFVSFFFFWNKRHWHIRSLDLIYFLFCYFWGNYISDVMKKMLYRMENSTIELFNMYYTKVRIISDPIFDEDSSSTTQTSVVNYIWIYS